MTDETAARQALERLVNAGLVEESVFAIAFTAPTWAKALVLLYGTILAPGRRTVTAALRAMGLADEKRFEKHHRVLNRDRWSPWILSKILLGLIIQPRSPKTSAKLNRRHRTLVGWADAMIQGKL